MYFEKEPPERSAVIWRARQEAKCSLQKQSGASDIIILILKGNKRAEERPEKNFGKKGSIANLEEDGADK